MMVSQTAFKSRSTSSFQKRSTTPLAFQFGVSFPIVVRTRTLAAVDLDVSLASAQTKSAMNLPTGT
jgi:hypothetical protein